MNHIASILTAAIIITACGGKNTESNVDSPGEEKSGKTKALETGADLLQNNSPLKKINAYWTVFIFTMGI